MASPSLSQSGSLSVCFTFKDIDSQELCNRLYEESKGLVSFGIYAEKAFVRLVLVNSENEEADILNFFKTIEDFVK